MTRKSLFPLFLKLQDRPCLVVGAGPIGESKIASLLAAGAKVLVVAPRATRKVEAWARRRRIRWLRREFRPADLRGILLVVAATSSRGLHEKIFRLARKQNALCNVVDDPPLCDFYYPAVVRRGALQIAISTTGRSPALAQRLRKQLERQFGPEFKEWLEHLGELREKLRTIASSADQRRRLLHQHVSEDAFRRFLRGLKGPGRRRGKR